MSDYFSPLADITIESLMQDEPPSVESMQRMSEEQGWDALFDYWEACSLGAYMQPSTNTSSGSCRQSSQAIVQDRYDPAFAMSSSRNVQPNFTCFVKGCGSKAFKRKAELDRHALTHTSQRGFPCMAYGCNYSFTRKDKLVDHIRAGHDDNALFACTNPDCRISFTRDIIPLHIKEFAYMQKYRKCPMPRCKFNVANARLQSLDLLQEHLRDEHDTRGRNKFANLLAERGYDSETVQVVCPICPDTEGFVDHADFYRHFLIEHIPRFSACQFCPNKSSLSPEELRTHAGEHGKYNVEKLTNKAWSTMTQGYGNSNATAALRSCVAVPREVHEHRHILLSLWPDFEDHPTWDDMKRCST